MPTTVGLRIIHVVLRVFEPIPDARVLSMGLRRHVRVIFSVPGPGRLLNLPLCRRSTSFIKRVASI